LAQPQILRYENELRLLEVSTFTTHPLFQDTASVKDFSVFPTLINEGDLVTVSYSVVSPQPGDFIALYINSSSLTARQLPLKWAYIDDSTYLASGRGSKRFQLANFRSLQGYVFGLLTGSTRDRYGSLSIYNASLVALSSAVTIDGDVLGPQKPRITLGSPSGASTLRVTWTSGRDASSSPGLAWGLTKGGPYPYIGREVTTTHLTNASFCGAPANGVGFSDLGFVHSALVVLGDAGLPPAAPPTSFFFVLSDAAATAGTGREFRARVPPPPGPRYPSTLLAFDDLGRGSLDDAKTYGEYGTPAVNTSLSIAKLLSAAPDGYMGVWVTGDLSYATGTLAVWDWFVFMVSPWASQVLGVFGVGNHESGSKWLPGSTTAAPGAATHNSLFDTNDSGGECSVATLHLLPPPSPATLDAPSWAAPIGPMYLITLGTEHNFSTGSPQWLWLEGVLGGINRTTTPWVLLGAHRPMYVDSNYVQDTPSQRGAGPSTADIPVMAQMQEHLEPLTMRYKVSLALYGHNHVVQRLTPAYRNASVQASVPAVRPQQGDTPPAPTRLFSRPTATLHMVVGTGGAGFTRNCAAEVGLDPPSWSERCFYQWGTSWCGQ